MKASSSSTVFWAAAGSSPVSGGRRGRCARPPALIVPAGVVRPGGGRFEIGLRFLQLALANRQQRRRGDIDQLLGAIPRLHAGRADRVRIARVREHLRLEVRGVFVDGLTRIVGRRCQTVLNCPIGDVGERQRQIAGHQVGGAAEHHDCPGDEHPRRVAKVLACGREQPRHARQFRRHLPRSRRGGRRLHGHQVVDAIRDRRRVDHRVAGPRADGVEVEEPPVDDALENPAIDAFVRRQRSRIDRVDPLLKRAQPLDLRGNRRRREVLEFPVVRVNAIAGGNRGMTPRELIEVFVDERGELRRRVCPARRRRSLASEAERDGEHRWSEGWSHRLTIRPPSPRRMSHGDGGRLGGSHDPHAPHDSHRIAFRVRRRRDCGPATADAAPRDPQARTRHQRRRRLHARRGRRLHHRPSGVADARVQQVADLERPIRRSATSSRTRSIFRGRRPCHRRNSAASRSSARRRWFRIFKSIGSTSCRARTITRPTGASKA